MTDKVAIVGAGLVGRAWAISFARGGHRVMLFDADDKAVASALSTVEGMLRTLELRGMLKGQTAADVRSRITGAASLEAALAGAAHVQENVPEDLGVKREMFAKLDAASEKNAVLASSSSGILPSRISAELAGKSRCLVAHPINPPYLIPAVELVPAPWTDPQVVERTRQRLAGLGQAPIVMRRELDGFIMNRLQGALLHEAFRLVAEGYASSEDVDAGICKGIGLRWAFMGPFETIDLNAPGGIRDYVDRYEGLYQTLAQSQAVPVPWSGELLDRIEAERCRRLPRAESCRAAGMARSPLDGAGKPHRGDRQRARHLGPQGGFSRRHNPPLWSSSSADHAFANPPYALHRVPTLRVAEPPRHGRKCTAVAAHSAAKIKNTKPGPLAITATMTSPMPYPPDAASMARATPTMRNKAARIA